MKKKLFLVIFLIFSAANLTDRPSALFASEMGLFEDEILSVDKLYKKQQEEKPGSFLIFDARNKLSYDTAHIKDAVLPLTDGYYRNQELFRQGLISQMPDSDPDLKENTKKYDKKIPIITYCNTDCQASSVLLLKLKKIGFTDVRVMPEGFQVWEEKGYPVWRAEE